MCPMKVLKFQKIRSNLSSVVDTALLTGVFMRGFLMFLPNHLLWLLHCFRDAAGFFTSKWRVTRWIK